MLRVLILTVFPISIAAQCSTCNNQNGYIGIYGNSYASTISPSTQYSSGQYMCNSCTMMSGQQYTCGSCQYSPSSNQMFLATTAAPSYTLNQCTCNNCQTVQGAQYNSPQYSCNTCQYNYATAGSVSTMSPYATQQFYNPSSQYSGSTSTMSPYATQQFYNPSSQYSGSMSTMSPYGTQQLYNPSSQYSGSMSTMSATQQFYNPSSQYSGCTNCQYNTGFSTTASPYSNQQSYNPSTQSSGCSNCQYNNGYSSAAANQQFSDQNQFTLTTISPTLHYNDLTDTNLGYPYGYSTGSNSASAGSQPMYDQNSANQDNLGTYTSGQYLPGVQGHLYDTRIGLTQFNTEVKK